MTEQPQHAGPDDASNNGIPLFDSIVPPDTVTREVPTSYFLIAYPHAFLAACRELHRSVAEGEIGTTDMGLPIPMMYCFRHYVETMLKDCTAGLCELLELPLPASTNPRHRKNPPPMIAVEHALQPLWNELKALISQSTYPRDASHELAVETIVRDLHRTDPNAETFRYWKWRDGRVSLTSIPPMRLKELPYVIDTLGRYFDSVADYVMLAAHAKRKKNGTMEFGAQVVGVPAVITPGVKVALVNSPKDPSNPSASPRSLSLSIQIQKPKSS